MFGNKLFDLLILCIGSVAVVVSILLSVAVPAAAIVFILWMIFG